MIEFSCFFLSKQNHSQQETLVGNVFPPKAPSIYSSGESYLPPSRPTDINAHYTSNRNINDHPQYTEVNTAPTNIYHAANSGPVGYANLQPNTAPNVTYQATYS
jgi:hypothetical protein